MRKQNRTEFVANRTQSELVYFAMADDGEGEIEVWHEHIIAWRIEVLEPMDSARDEPWPISVDPITHNGPSNDIDNPWVLEQRFANGTVMWSCPEIWDTQDWDVVLGNIRQEFKDRARQRKERADKKRAAQEFIHAPFTELGESPQKTPPK